MDVPFLWMMSPDYVLRVAYWSYAVQVMGKPEASRHVVNAFDSTGSVSGTKRSVRRLVSR
jgi:hypothetical protein